MVSSHLTSIKKVWRPNVSQCSFTRKRAIKQLYCVLKSFLKIVSVEYIHPCFLVISLLLRKVGGQMSVTVVLLGVIKQ